MPKVIALVPTNVNRSPLERPSCLGETIAGKTVLAHTLHRLSRVPQLEAIVLVHPAGQKPLALVEGEQFRKPVLTCPDPQGLRDRWHDRRKVSRLWAPAAWRGGLGGAGCHDELLPAAPLLEAMQRQEADSALLVGADWLLVDPDLCSRLLALHLEHPEAMSMTFCQAPPGLAGLALSRKPLTQLLDSDATFGQGLSYNPTRPQADPIGRDVCIQVPGAVRAAAQRFIYDCPRSAALLQRLAQVLGAEFPTADSAAVATGLAGIPALELRGLRPLPARITLEITPRRAATGPITPQHYLQFERADMTPANAQRLLAQIAREPDAVVTLGGLGDALLHPQWEEIVQAAHAAGISSLAVDTDLLVEPEVMDRLLELPVDVVTVRLNADSGTTYARLMGRDDFKRVLENLTRLFNGRIARDQANPSRPRLGLPWILPRMVKTHDILEEMESFFDKWTHFLGHAVIEPATTGCGLIPDLATHNLAPPRRFPCRQLARRMTILSDGAVALCDQDWLGRDGCAVQTDSDTALAQAWEQLAQRVAAQHEDRWDQLPLCSQCREWHRP